MPELMITPTPTQLPGTTGNANALSQSEAMGRSGDSAKADAESSEAPPLIFCTLIMVTAYSRVVSPDTNSCRCFAWIQSVYHQTVMVTKVISCICFF